MTCSEARAKLNDLARARLRPEVASQVEEHAAGCPECTKALKVEKAFHSALEVTIRESGESEAEILSVAAGYRPRHNRWKVNTVALAIGIAIPFALIFLLSPSISFEDILVFHHLGAPETDKIDIRGDRAELSEFLGGQLEADTPLPEGFEYLGARPVKIQGYTAVQILIQQGGNRLSLIVVPPLALDRMPDLSERLGTEGRASGRFQDHSVAVVRNRFLIGLVGSIDLAELEKLISPFRGL